MVVAGSNATRASLQDWPSPKTKPKAGARGRVATEGSKSSSGGGMGGGRVRRERASREDHEVRKKGATSRR